MSFVAVSVLRDPFQISVAGALQTVIVYGLFLVMYRGIPTLRKRKADEDPHPWREMQSREPALLAA